MMKISKRSFSAPKSLAALTCTIVAATAQAGSLFPAGTESKAAGNESSLLCEGAPAALYNPANLAGSSAKANQPYAELGFVNVNYTYEHPDFDPVTVSVNSPTATFGFARQILPKLTVGTVLFPSKSGKTNISALPRKVGSSVTPVVVSSQDQVMDLGVGAGYQVSRRIALGLSADITQESHKINAHLIDNSNDLIDAQYKNTFVRPIFGARLTPIPPFTATLAIKPAQTKEYKGTQSSATTPAAQSPRAVDYEPLSVAFGTRGDVARASFGFEVRRLAWSKGKGIVKSATYDDKPQADLNDVTEYNVTAGYDLPRNTSLSAGLAFQPTPWGSGKDDGNLANHVYGADYGRLDAMDRRTYALGIKTHLKAFELSLSLAKTHGERTVSGEADNVGYYELDVTSVSGGLSASF